MSRWKRIAVAASVAVGVMGLAAGCGKSPDLGDIAEGETFEMHDVRFNVLYDRFLNGQDTEDASYVEGLPEPPDGKQYFAVFVLLKNLGDADAPAPGMTDFQITDTTSGSSGVVYRPLKSDSAFAFPFGETFGPDEEIPDPDSVAASGPTQGSLLLYLLDTGVSENRPLEMRIRYLGEEAVVKLDL